MIEDLAREIAMAKGNITRLQNAGTGGTLLDLGANVGEVSIRLADRFDRVIAVEAHPLTAARARARVEEAGLNDKIVVIQAVVHSVAGVGMFVSTPGFSTSVTARTKPRLKKDLSYYQKVASVAFQDLVDEYRPRVIKMDIEGGEYDCLETFRANVELEHVVVEFHSASSVNGFARLLTCGRNLNRQGFSVVFPNTMNLGPNGCPKFGYLTVHFDNHGGLAWGIDDVCAYD